MYLVLLLVSHRNKACRKLSCEGRKCVANYKSSTNLLLLLLLLVLLVREKKTRKRLPQWTGSQRTRETVHAQSCLR